MTLFARGTYPNGHRFLIGFASEAKLKDWAEAHKAEITHTGTVDSTTPIVASRTYIDNGELVSEPIWADEFYKR